MGQEGSWTLLPAVFGGTIAVLHISTRAAKLKDEDAMSPEPLAEENAIYEANLEEWRRTHLGEYVLIKGRDVLGFYSSLDKAFDEGTKRFGLEPFFVKQVHPSDAVNVSLFGRRLLTSK
jgi:hypothetical protein